jgi:hypothetical protein
MSSTELIRRYFTERYRSGFFVPLAVLLYGTGMLALGSSTTPVRSIAGIIVAYALVLFFRILDDNADRAGDRVRHPTRVTVLATDLKPLMGVAAIAAALAVGLVAPSPSRTTALIALAITAGVIGGWYSSRRSIAPGRRLNALVVLIKYPVIAFVAATAGATSPVDASAFAGPTIGFSAIYLIACTYEVLHDRGLQT